MSNTNCRMCDIVVKGLYLNCPRCGKYLMPKEFGEGVDIPPEPFELVRYGESWNVPQTNLTESER